MNLIPKKTKCCASLFYVKFDRIDDKVINIIVPNDYIIRICSIII